MSDALELAVEAVIYTYPLYEMSRMRAATSPRRLVSVGFAGDGPQSMQRWCNTFTHTRDLLTSGTSRVVTPNNDTLYTNAWLDLSTEPLVIDVPDTAGRYYVLGLLDFFTNPFAHLGQRCTGTGAGSFMITSPGWRGEVPAQFRAPGRHIESPTRWIWIIGRILVDGEHDVPAVNALQDDFVLRPLSAWRVGAPTVPTRFDAVIDARAPLTAEHYSAVVNAALRDSLVPALEVDMVARFAAVGIGADCTATDEQMRHLGKAIELVMHQLRGGHGDESVAASWGRPIPIEASFGTQYLRRALVALKYIGALESLEACYSLVHHDADGDALTGENAYRLRFAPGQEPLVRAFWSITMYAAADCMLVANPIARYAIGNRTTGLRRDADGALTLYLQCNAPTESTAVANWLPAPRGHFYLCLRAYLPQPEMLDGRYGPPDVVRMSAFAK